MRVAGGLTALVLGVLALANAENATEPVSGTAPGTTQAAVPTEVTTSPQTSAVPTTEAETPTSGKAPVLRPLNLDRTDGPIIRDTDKDAEIVVGKLDSSLCCLVCCE